MAFVISDSCISCGSCAGECPVNAIAEGDGKFEIDEAYTQLLLPSSLKVYKSLLL